MPCKSTHVFCIICVIIPYITFQLNIGGTCRIANPRVMSRNCYHWYMYYSYMFTMHVVHVLHILHGMVEMLLVYGRVTCLAIVIFTGKSDCAEHKVTPLYKFK